MSQNKSNYIKRTIQTIQPEKYLKYSNVRVIASDDGLYARIHMRDLYLVARTLLCIPPRVAGVGWELSCDVTLALASSDVGPTNSYCIEEL